MKKMANRVKLITIGITLAVIMSGCNSEKELNSYEQGVQAIELQHYNEALQAFKAYETTGKDLKKTYRGEGLAYLGLGQYDEALSSFKLALEQSNGLLKKIDYDINFYMAVAEYKSGRLEDALNTYTAIVQADKNNSDAFYLRGKVNLDLGNIDAAKNDFDKAIELNKDDSRLYINIHDDFSAKDMDTDAKAYISKGVATVSKPSSYELGIFNYYLGDYTQARNYFEESSETKKTEEGIIYLGKTYEALDDAGYAMALYEEFATNNETPAIVYNELGLLKVKNRDYEGALAEFEAGLKNENASCKQSLMFNRIVANERLGNFEEAKKQVESYLALYPSDETAIKEGIFLSTR
ncbi:MAG: tetratricopeptide repeat protein [Lachnospiraceae bacterium]|nr:tetratricopeptide repeat protein [Lachnospiraceae bacterium]